MSKDQKDLRLMLIILGLVELILPSIALFLILPEVYKLDKSLESNAFNPYLSFGFFGIIVILSTMQIIRGLFIKNSNPKTSKRLLIIGGFFGLATIPAIIAFVVTPIYGILDSVG